MIDSLLYPAVLSGIGCSMHAFSHSVLHVAGVEPDQLQAQEQPGGTYRLHQHCHSFS